MRDLTVLVVCGRYVSQVLEEAKLMSQHARKKTIDVGDVRLGCLMLRERSWARPPGRLLISQLGRSKNSQALPVPGARLGLRLPPDRFSLTAPNFRSHSPPRPDWSALIGRRMSRLVSYWSRVSQ